MQKVEVGAVEEEILEKTLLDINEGVIIHLVGCQGEMKTGFSDEIQCRYYHIYQQYRELCSRYEGDTLLGQVQIIYQGGLNFAFLFAQSQKGLRQKRLKLEYSALKRALKRVNEAFAGRKVWIAYPLGCEESVNGQWERVEGILKETLTQCEYQLFRSPKPTNEITTEK